MTELVWTNEAPTEQVSCVYEDPKTGCRLYGAVSLRTGGLWFCGNCDGCEEYHIFQRPLAQLPGRWAYPLPVPVPEEPPEPRRFRYRLPSGQLCEGMLASSGIVLVETHTWIYPNWDEFMSKVKPTAIEWLD